MNKVVIAFDSFKGSVSSSEISAVVELAVPKIFPNCKVISLPIADGGEGTVQSICNNRAVEWIEVEVHDPLMNPIDATYAITKQGQIAIMEISAASGLPLIPEKYRDPMNTTTFGTGEMIKDALKRGCEKFILGIGGSATNDAATGMLSALGFSFRDADNKELSPIGRNLINIENVDESNVNPLLKNAEFTIICDVDNPFCGADGAAMIFAPQKGASSEETRVLDIGLKHYADLIKRKMGIDIKNVPGSGAAGGVGGGVLPFLNCKLQSGIKTILDLLDFKDLIKDADLILTGEGKIDAQTEMGKALDQILKIANRSNIPTIALVGSIDPDFENDNRLTALFSIQPAPISLEKAMEKDFTLKNIERSTIQILKIIKTFEKCD